MGVNFLAIIYKENVDQTNNHPKLIGGYFLEATVTANGGCPSKIKTYYGDVAAFQTFLRRNDPDDDIQYIYGTSTRNQRTES